MSYAAASATLHSQDIERIEAAVVAIPALYDACVCVRLVAAPYWGCSVTADNVLSIPAMRAELSAVYTALDALVDQYTVDLVGLFLSYGDEVSPSLKLTTETAASDRGLGFTTSRSTWSQRYSAGDHSPTVVTVHFDSTLELAPASVKAWHVWMAEKCRGMYIHVDCARPPRLV